MGAVQKVCHRSKGGGSSSKIVTKCDKGKGVKPKSVVTISNFFLYGHDTKIKGKHSGDQSYLEF